MKNIKIILGFALAFSLVACQKADHAAESVQTFPKSEPASPVEERVKAPVMDKSTQENKDANTFIPSSAAVENGKDSTRKFVRTADLKFKVKSVITSTYDIEAITAKQGGFVAFTNLTSSISNVTNTAISADSSLETTKYVVSNTITLRVPNVKLDTTLKLIAKNIDYLDYRIIKAEDVALQMLSNDLAQKRAAKNEARLTNAIDNRGKKLQETADAENALYNREEQGDNAKIANLSLKDQINFSTINLSIYQRETIKREMIANEENIDEYEPHLGIKIWQSLKGGWHILAAIFLFLVEIWGLILFGIVGFFVYKKYIKKQ